MGIKSTPFISYHEINVTETDLFEDALDLYSGYSDVKRLLSEYKPEPGSQLVSSLIELLHETR